MSLLALGPSYVTRAEQKAARKKAADAHTREVHRAVDTRDKGRCRCCGVRVKVTLELDPLRRERHHIIPRSAGGETETWNLVTLAFQCHERATRHQMRVVGNADETLVFSVDGRTWTSDPPRR